MESVWSAECELPRFPTLQESITTNVLVIGGGMAGLLCAHALQKAGVDTVLVEAKNIGSGITKDTTAKITSQHGLIYHKLLRQFGFEKARLYYKANQEALAAFCRLCADIDCDFSRQDSYVYSTDGRAKLEQEIAALSTLGIPATLVSETILPFPVAGAVKFANQAQFHPLKFLSAIVPELKIFENTAVRELVPHTAVTDFGTIEAKNIIVATHFPMLNKHGSYFLKLYQHRSYVLALENAGSVSGMYVDESDTGLSFRRHGDLLLLGGGSHRTGKPGGTWHELEAFTQKHYPDAKIRYRWATQDCMSLDGVPYIGPYSRRTEGLYVATGFNKWGMTSSMAAARLLTDQIRGKENPYTDLFSPSRSILRPQLAINGWEAAVNLLTPKAKRCPHLGCALKWNPQEHSWDCPCHGSRFSETGEILDNPANGCR